MASAGCLALMRRHINNSISNPLPQHIPEQASDLLCAICNKFVPVESAKTDGDGHAVHEECYVLKIRMTKPGNDGGSFS